MLLIDASLLKENEEDKEDRQDQSHCSRVSHFSSNSKAIRRTRTYETCRLCGASKRQDKMRAHVESHAKGTAKRSRGTPAPAHAPVADAPMVASNLGDAPLIAAPESDAPVAAAPIVTALTHPTIEPMTDAAIVTAQLHGPIDAAPLVSAPPHAPMLYAPAAFYDLQTKRAILQGLACQVVGQLTELECDIHLGLLRRSRRSARS